jgi:beta-N-acetylhexosaminidase
MGVWDFCFNLIVLPTYITFVPISPLPTPYSPLPNPRSPLPTPILLVFISILCLLLLPSCVRREAVNQNKNTVNSDKNEDTIEIIDPLRLRAAEIASSFDDRLLVAQVLISGIEGKGKLSDNIAALLTEFPTGGIMLFRYNLDTDNDSIRALLSQTAALVTGGSGIPPFMAVDNEGGAVNRFRRGTADLDAASSYWELSLAQGRQAALEKLDTDSFRAGRDLKDLGINLNFAPVTEYLNDANRIFLQSRSYGPDPVFTADAASVFIRGMHDAGILCVIKHFPGSAGNDPHYSASVLGVDRAELDNMVYPFTFLTARHRARAVMIAHSAVPAMDSKIASLSQVVMKDWLRDEIGFNGILIADDFSMAAAGEQSSEEAAILSVAAGADMALVWPKDLRRTHGAFVSALNDGRLSRERIREAAGRIIYEKLLLELM